MSRYSGAFADAVKWTFDKDMELKRDMLKKMTDEPEKYPWPEGLTMAQFLFGDIQAFIDRFKGREL